MDSKLDKLENKLDKLDNRLDNIDITMAKNTASLEEHMRRTDMLERELGPVKDHVQKVTWAIKGIFWFCSTLAAVVGFIYLLQQLGIFK